MMASWPAPAPLIALPTLPDSSPAAGPLRHGSVPELMDCRLQYSDEREGVR